MRSAERLERADRHTPAARDPYWLRRREAVYRWFASECLQAGHRRVLDAGCRSGFGTAVLAGTGLDAVGIDSDPRLITAARRTYRFGRVAFRAADARRTPELSTSFDAILGAGILEHVEDAQSLCAEWRRLLKPGGMIAVVTPNRLTASPGRTRPLQGSHAWEYTPDELHALLRWRFPDVKLLGLFHGARLRLVERMLGSSLPLTLRRVPPPDRAPWLRAAMRRVSTRDFVVGPGVVRDSLDLVAVART